MAQRANLMNPRMEHLLERVDSKFTLVTLSAMRAREINDYYNQLGEGLGKIVPPQVTSISRKPLSIAMEEIEAGKIEGIPLPPEEERAAIAAADDALIATLRSRLERLDPREEPVWRGYVMLGNAERSRGHLDAAGAAWDRALAARFDAGLALDYATLELERERPDAALAMLRRAQESGARGDVRVRLQFLIGTAEEQAGRPAEARRAWQEIIDESPPDAPWRAMLQRRMERLPE